MGRKPLIAGGACAVLIVIILVAFMLNRGGSDDPTTPVATGAAEVTDTPSPTATATPSEAPTTPEPTTAPAPTAKATTPAPAPAATKAPVPTSNSYARFAHPPSSSNGDAGKPVGTNTFYFPVDSVDPVESTILVHLSGPGVNETATCSKPNPGLRTSKCRWDTGKHLIAVSYYLTVEPADKSTYKSYRSAAMTFNIP